MKKKRIKVKVKLVNKPKDLTSDGKKPNTAPTKQFCYKGECQLGNGKEDWIVSTSEYPRPELAIESLASTLLVDAGLADAVLAEYRDLIDDVISQQSTISARDILYKTAVDAIKEYILPEYIIKEEVLN